MTSFETSPRAIASVVEFSISVDSSEIARVSTWLGEAGSARGVPPEPLWRLDLCVTEALANVIDHGGMTTGSRPISLRLNVHRGESGCNASVIVSDAGTEFNPLTAPLRPQARTLAEAMPGGQGLTLLRRFADALEYSYGEAQNHLTIQVRWSREKDGLPR